MPIARATQPTKPSTLARRCRTAAWFATKRAVDIVGALVLLAAASVPVVLAALAIAVLDGRPIFFRQERVGRHGAPFSIIKLRTMVTDAEARQASIAQHNTRTGPLFKAAHDPRITPPGRFLRSACIDELPQLWNIVRGDMSLVGPRPALPLEVAAFDPHHDEQRHRVRPGLTGPWQITPSAHDDFAAYRALDLDYVARPSARTDARILVATVALCARRGRATLRGDHRESASEVRPMPTVDLCDAVDPLSPVAGMHGEPVRASSHQALARTGTNA